MTYSKTSDIMYNYLPASTPQPWTWEDEEQDILNRTCCCRSHQCHSPSLGTKGHYQLALEDYIKDHGIMGTIRLGNDGRVWDGHHRLIAAKRLGIETVEVEQYED